MSRGLFLWCALMGLMLSAWGRSAMAQAVDANADPQAIAERCIEHIEADAKRCVDANQASCDRCVAAIEKALEAGNVERAHRIARACAHLINRRTNTCVALITAHCRRCVGLLERLGADELAARVKAACEDVLDRVNASRRDALAKIKEALGDDPGPPDDGDIDPALSAAARAAHVH